MDDWTLMTYFLHAVKHFIYARWTCDHCRHSRARYVLRTQARRGVNGLAA